MFKDLTTEELRELQWALFRGYQKAAREYHGYSSDLGWSGWGMANEIAGLVNSIAIFV